ncbi:putative zinc finger, C2H2 type [Lyophyllum shimeji]|uniref:Zinc finger, C2H2 type n=1 Tax=Lyophyllum shimeji TaxID=47721 RepID=A0A9P3PJJ0_LYOSH|nr:putative zinc finger, C2H2 type [Lyophyllum shimeji]
MTEANTVLETESILGKRSRNESLVLRLASSPEPRNTSGSEFEDHAAVKTWSSPPILVNGALISSTKKRYRCTHAACDKAYSKPSRLAEHERSHTGQRPFVCETCNKSYLRETHLQAHVRSHLPESSRPLLCPKENCGKRFWTSQHLRAHTDWHNGAKPFQCSEAGCGEAFTKHSQLRAHVCSVHAPPGTKPYRCEHEGCTRSFSTNQHLRTHSKVHDEKRYTCVHATCLPNSDNVPSYYPTWTALQHHIRTAHPPVCTHPSCNGRTFSSQKGLRAHQKLHEQRELEESMGDALGSDAEDPDTTQPPRKRRRGGEIGRDWKCDVVGCDKDFKSKKALVTHTNITHLGRRDHVCPHEGCGKTYGYKHLLRRHLAKAHSTTSADDDETSEGDETDETGYISGSKPTRKAKNATSLDIDTITGHSYAKRARENLANATALFCPYPHLDCITVVLASDDRSPGSLSQSSTARTCEYAFSRAYDLRRHLKAVHALDTTKESVDRWVKERKTELRPAAGPAVRTPTA